MVMSALALAACANPHVSARPFGPSPAPCPPAGRRRRRRASGGLTPTPVYQCASTGRFEANRLETVRDLVKE
jgi:hypothetical protein